MEEPTPPTPREKQVITVRQLLQVTQQHGRPFITDAQSGSLFLYNGTHWQEIPNGLLGLLLSEAAEAFGTDPTEISAPFGEGLKTIFKRQAAKTLQTPAESLINLNNGTLKFTHQGAQLCPFSPNDFLRYQLNFDYDPNAQCPRFQRFLDEVLPNTQIQNVLAEYLGYCFLPINTHAESNARIFKLEKVPLLVGSGANGKSVFFEVVSAIFGNDNIGNTGIQDLVENKNYALSTLDGKLLNYCSEFAAIPRADIFKQLVSCEPINARKIYQAPYTMKNYARLMFNCNKLPKAPEKGDAFYRRFLIIPFLVTIPEHKQDPQLAQKIIETERPGILNWIIQGLHRIMKQRKLTDVPELTNSLTNYKKDTDPVLSFLDELGWEAPNIATTDELENADLVKDTTNAAETYRKYLTYCEECHYKPLGRNNFYSDLREKGYTMEKINEWKTHWTRLTFLRKRNSSDPLPF